MAYKSQYMKPSNRRPIQLGSVMMRVALVLLCMVMISFHLMGSMYARYTTKASSSDDARVAKFDVKVTGDTQAVSVDCAVTTDNVYTITIKNDSEVAVSYEINVAKSVGVGSETFDTDGVTVTVDQQSGSLAVGTQTERTLTFTVNDWSKITEHMTGENGEVTLKFSVTINIVQVD